MGIIKKLKKDRLTINHIALESGIQRIWRDQTINPLVERAEEYAWIVHTLAVHLKTLNNFITIII